jgi:hypothetical protein
MKTVDTYVFIIFVQRNSFVFKVSITRVCVNFGNSEKMSECSNRPSEIIIFLSFQSSQSLNRLILEYRNPGSPGLRSRVAIFRQKNYSAKIGTSRNRRQFRRNPASFAEEKNLGIPFRTIARKRKTLGIPFLLFRTISRKRKTIRNPFRTISRKGKPLGISFRTIFGWEKPRNFVPNHFRKRKPQNSVPNHFRNRINFRIPFRIIFGTEKTWEKDNFC